MKIHSFKVTPNLPENMKFLEELSNNMWFAWNWPAINLFVKIDEALWAQSHRSPKWLMASVSQKRLEELSKDRGFIEHLNTVEKLYRDYRASNDTWFDENKGEGKDNFLVAYFSMEYGIGEGLPIYSGGLGMLSGDHMKSASDLGMPILGVGLFYQKGYVKQVLNKDGWQGEEYPGNDWAHLSVEAVLNKDGSNMTVDIPLGREVIKAMIWRVPVGRASLYLLDTNLPDNAPQHRTITETLYGGDRENRIKQEIVLGIGGVKALKAMGTEPSVYHINEGHSAFLLCERIIDIMQQRKISFAEAREIVWATSVFTTHTPVIAGNEYFEFSLIRKYLDPYVAQLGIGWDAFMELGKTAPSSPQFCMTVFALKLSAYLNGVAKLHGKVSREMWKDIWAGLNVDEVPITSITNGVHAASWASHEHTELYKMYLGDSAISSPLPKIWDKADNIPPAELWQIHQIRKQKLIQTVRNKTVQTFARLNPGLATPRSVGKLLREDALTIGFARRFATYKRATLLFRDLNRLADIVNNTARPVQFVFAGKAHPADASGKEFIKLIFNAMQDPRFKNKIIFVEDYNMNLARYMVQGVDVWLNNPIRPLEASGTSGMKAALNGGLQLSILDGWWDEVGPCDYSWSIIGAKSYKDETERDEVESQALYSLIENEISPLYYERNADGLPEKWLKMMINSLKNIVPFFNTNRMVIEYYEKFYSKAYYYGRILQSAGKTAEVAAWRTAIAANWPRVSITDTTPVIDKAVLVGQTVKFKARVSLGGLRPQDVVVQLQLGLRAAGGGFECYRDSVMKNSGKEGDVYLYEAEVQPDSSGRTDYALRILPFNQNIPNPFTPIHVAWEE
ncbi:MAG: alpha-glucan family phosphorylase [Elusimicrobiota bacterium]|jgi:starch phosphorylase|nr:alpha-glucan family phosphorylase [Elusimicrobiota bacterium]